MGIGTNGHLEQMSTLEPMGIWDREHVGTGTNGHLGERAL